MAHLGIRCRRGKQVGQSPENKADGDPFSVITSSLFLKSFKNHFSLPYGLPFWWNLNASKKSSIPQKDLDKDFSLYYVLAKNDIYFSKTEKMNKLQGCLEILELLANIGHPLEVKEICQNMGLSGSTLYRYVNNLTRLELIEYEPSSRKYHLGIKLVRLGHLATRQLEIHRQAYPIMEELTQKTGDSAILTVRRGTKAIVVEFVEIDRTGIKFAMNRGDILPLYCCAITRPLMAFLPEEEIECILRANRPKGLTSHTITDLKKIKGELRKIRRQGYAMSSQELTLGAKGLGAPIRDYSGKVIAALGLVGPIHDFSKGKIPHLLEILLAATKQCSLKMGSKV